MKRIRSAVRLYWPSDTVTCTDGHGSDLHGQLGLQSNSISGTTLSGRKPISGRVIVRYDSFKMQNVVND
jgi:hypothetical protein